MTRRGFLIAGAGYASAAWARSHWDRSRIGIITDEFGATSDGAVDQVHDLGLQAVELRNQPGTSRAYVMAREAEIQADATRLMNERIKISCVDTSLLKFTSSDSDDLRKALRCAQICATDKVRIFAGARAADPSAMLPAIAAALNEFAAEADKQKITLLLTNHPATNVATCAELAAVMKLVPSRALAIDWNPHASHSLETPFPAGYALLPKKRILNVRAEAVSLSPGTPEAEDWKAILQALDRDGYTGRIVLETGATGKNRIAMARDALDQLAHIVREVS